MTDRARKDIAAIVRDGAAIDRAIETARRRVMRRHRQLGIPLAIWQEGRVVEISPENIATLEQGEPEAKNRD
jgi:hypothetical protein